MIFSLPPLLAFMFFSSFFLNLLGVSMRLEYLLAFYRSRGKLHMAHKLVIEVRVLYLSFNTDTRQF